MNLPAPKRCAVHCRVSTDERVDQSFNSIDARSLTDFFRLIEVFERHKVSFVAVTQQFNTTTSMGRLMLNVLLSFAQFEREVTGERIRDKIAASKAKGMWMGGPLPLWGMAWRTGCSSSMTPRPDWSGASSRISLVAPRRPRWCGSSPPRGRPRSRDGL